MNPDEICLTCSKPRAAHERWHLQWGCWSKGKRKEVDFWQDDVCPWLHNLTQPPWDVYLFRGKDSYAKSNRPDWVDE